MRPLSLYLLGYNLAACAGWAMVLVSTIQNLYIGGSQQQLWQAVKPFLVSAQATALLEVVHSALRLVRAPLPTTAMQVTSRVWVLWGIVLAVPDATTTGAVRLGRLHSLPLQLNLTTLLLAWSITEVIRYSFFACKELGASPYPLLWLRYTTFIVLYPLGVASELAMVYLALPSIRRRGFWSMHMPNRLNFAFDYYTACLCMLAAYLPGFPKLYFYMIAQRKKVLRPQKQSKHL